MLGDRDARKYREVTAQGSIQVGETGGTDHGWSTRRERVAQLGKQRMCDLVEVNRSGSGPHTPSLAVVRTAGPPALLVHKHDRAQHNLFGQLIDPSTGDTRWKTQEESA